METALRVFQQGVFLLERTIAVEGASEAERAGLVQFFLNGLRAGLEGLERLFGRSRPSSTTTRETLKQAFQSGLIVDGHLLIEALRDRNRHPHL